MRTGMRLFVGSNETFSCSNNGKLYEQIRSYVHCYQDIIEVVWDSFESYST